MVLRLSSFEDILCWKTLGRSISVVTCLWKEMDPITSLLGFRQAVIIIMLLQSLF
uniref:Uncharacterized protein n=1 Tax=Ostertagia ostertagi TaxID=6317 RepID=O61600_OSTOS|nr:unknown [Ostertagia ostertagi]